MNEEQVKKIKKVLKTDLKEYLKIMKENNICHIKIEDEDKLLGILLPCKASEKNIVKDFEEHLDKCLKNIEKMEDIKSHMVGRFYIAMNQEGEYYKSGDKIQKGKPIGFIETMNIMHEINAKSDGVIVNILVDNGKVVEYSQPLIQYKIN